MADNEAVTSKEMSKRILVVRKSLFTQHNMQKQTETDKRIVQSIQKCTIQECKKYARHKS